MSDASDDFAQATRDHAGSLRRAAKLWALRQAAIDCTYCRTSWDDLSRHPEDDGFDDAQRELEALAQMAEREGRDSD